MGVFSRIKGWLNMLLWKEKAQDVFNVKLLENDKTDEFIRTCMNIYTGNPSWLSEDDEVRTINIAQTVCSEIGRLATINADLTISGSARADWLNEQMHDYIPLMRQWVEYGCAAGEIILKPNGDDIDVYLPDRYIITEEIGTRVKGAVFLDSYYDANYERGKWYTRFEYHRIASDGTYTIINKAYIGDNYDDYSREVPLTLTRWKNLAEETTVTGVEKLLFGRFRTPLANNIDTNSKRGIPVFSGAIEEMRDLDIAYSRNAWEIDNSRRTVLLDSDRLLAVGGKVGKDPTMLLRRKGLPKYVKTVEGTGTGDIYHEINPTLNTEMRKSGIDGYLSQIGFKCGFSNGYFVFNQKTGLVTATQVESDDRRTLQTIADVRKQFEACLSDLIEALDKFADAYGLAPKGTYEVTYDFEDLTMNADEDRARWLSYVQQGWITFAYYLEKFEGMSKEEAEDISQQRTPEEMESLFAGLQAGAGENGTAAETSQGGDVNA